MSCEAIGISALRAKSTAYLVIGARLRNTVKRKLIRSDEALSKEHLFEVMFMCYSSEKIQQRDKSKKHAFLLSDGVAVPKLQSF